MHARAQVSGFHPQNLNHERGRGAGPLAQAAAAVHTLTAARSTGAARPPAAASRRQGRSWCFTASLAATCVRV